MEVKRRYLSFVGAVAFAVVVLFSFSGVSNAMEFANGRFLINGFYKNWTAYRFGFYGHERGSGLSMFRNVLQIETEIKVKDNFSLVGIYRLVREPEYNLEDAARDSGNFDGDVMDENKFRELYLAWQATDKLWIGLGKQQVVWGDLGGQGLRVMDIINPLDLRWHYATESFEDIRKPLVMSNVIYSLPAIEANVQFVWVPGLEDTWERVNSVYTNPGHRYGINNLADPTKPPDYFTPGVPEDDEADPNGIDRGISDSDVGIRWQQMAGPVTYALMFGHIHNQSPAVWVDASGLNIEYLRQNVYGVSANYYNQLTNGVWRFECGYFPNTPYTGNNFELERVNTFKYGLGYDRNTFFHWLPNGDRRSISSSMQILGTFIPHNDKFDHQNHSGVGGKNSDIMFTLFLNWGVSNDRVQFNLYPAYNIDRDFGIIQAWVDYRPQYFHGDLLITPKVNLFYGRKAIDGDFGLVRGASECLLEIKYEF